MCAEKEPLDCHRTLLVSRALERLGASVAHILADGSLETQDQTWSRLIDLTGLSKEDLFHDNAELLARACKLREDKIAYVKEQPAAKITSPRKDVPDRDKSCFRRS